MKTKRTIRILPGFALGMAAGALPALLYVFRLRHLCRYGFNSFDETMEILFGLLFEKHYALLMIGLGAAIGAAIGVSIAISERCFVVTMAFICGIAIGVTTLSFPARKLMEANTALWEQTCANERAFTYLQSLKAIERGKTNQLYLMRFQSEGQMVLTNYLRETERQMQNFSGKKYFNMDFLFTNSAAYSQVKKYAATHTNSLPIGGDF